MIISCIFAFVSAQKQFLEPKPYCGPKSCFKRTRKPYCVKYDDGSIKDLISSNVPCGKGIAGYFRGSCSELQGKSHVQK